MASHPRFRLLSHTADVAARIYGASLPDIFANAAVALTSLWVDNPRSINTRIARHFEVEGLDTEDLLVRWLSELIYTLDADGFIASKFDVQLPDDRHLLATAHGDHFDPARHHRRIEVKAATYHALKVTEAPPGRWTATVLFDI